MDIPGYKIIRELGRGGMAIVYLAEHEKFGREVALKVMSAALGDDESFQTRFLREARTLARTSHPNIVTVYDVDVHEGNYYFSMEFHTGGDLKDRLREGLSPADALRITREMASALGRAHECGIIHRDIKPGNILFARDGRAILTDFGIARNYDAETQLTQLGTMVGTPRYMSPEQARGMALEGPSDLYSLGIVLYEMLAGVPPFQAEDAIALGIKHVSEPPPPLPDDLAEYQPLVERLLAKEPQDRPTSGDSLAREIAEMERTLPPASRIVRQLHAPIQSPSEATLVSAPRPARSLASDLGQTQASGAPISKQDTTTGSSKTFLWAGGALATLALAAGAYFLQPASDTPRPAPVVTAAAPPALRADPDSDVARWLQRAGEALAADQLMTPENDNAVLWFQRVLKLRPDNPAARAGLDRVAERYVELGEQKLKRRDTDSARLYAERARQLAPGATGLTGLEAKLAGAEADNTKREQKLLDLGTQLRVTGLLGGARTAEEEGKRSEAIRLYRQALDLDAGNREAREGLARLEREPQTVARKNESPDAAE